MTTLGQRQLLFRRNRRTGELAFYRCYSPAPVPLHELVRVAGRRWSVEESFQTSKALTGLDKHQVRLWHSWKRCTAYWSVAGRDVAWSYDFPTAPLLPIAGLVAFFNERIDLTLDDIPQECPVTPFS